MRERAEEWTLRTMKKHGSLLGQAIPRNAFDSLIKKGLIRKVTCLYFGPRERLYTLSPAGVQACEHLDVAD